MPSEMIQKYILKTTVTKLILLVIATLLVSVNFAQTKIDQHDVRDKSYFDYELNKIFFVSNDTLYEYQGENRKALSRLEMEEIPVNSKLVIKNGVIHFIGDLGGEVYKKENNRIIRIDKSFQHKNQLSANLFLYKDAIYKFGGYGFFGARDFFTYFSDITREWEVLTENESSIRPAGLFDTKSFVIDEYFYVFGGYSIDVINRNKSIPNQQFWRFSFTEKKWTLLGNMELLNVSASNFDFTYGKNFYFLYEEDLLELNVNSLKIKRLRNPNLFKKVNGTFPGLINDGKIHILMSNDNSDKSKYSLEHFDLSVMKSTETLEINKTFRVQPIYVAFILLSIILSLVIFYIKRNNQLKLKNANLYFRHKNIALTLDENQFMELLINQKTVDNNKLIAVLNEQFAASHKSKLKNDIIHRLNDKLTIVCNGIYHITKIRDPQDKRFYNYSLEKK